jgi:hypothetical protein
LKVVETTLHHANALISVHRHCIAVYNVSATTTTTTTTTKVLTVECASTFFNLRSKENNDPKGMNSIIIAIVGGINANP